MDIGPQFPTRPTKTQLSGFAPQPGVKAGARTRTGDPFITNEVLYQLSYAGRWRDSRLAAGLGYASSS